MPGRGSEGGKSPEELRREARQIEASGEAGGKDPSRVAGGKKAAATRKEEHHRGSGHGSDER